jgi:hypothetical protein
MKYLTLVFVLGLAACGAEAPPTPPTTGIGLSGEAMIGLRTAL